MGITAVYFPKILILFLTNIVFFCFVLLFFEIKGQLLSNFINHPLLFQYFLDNCVSIGIVSTYSNDSISTVTCPILVDWTFTGLPWTLPSTLMISSWFRNLKTLAPIISDPLFNYDFNKAVTNTCQY